MGIISLIWASLLAIVSALWLVVGDCACVVPSVVGEGGILLKGCILVVVGLVVTFFVGVRFARVLIVLVIVIETVVRLLQDGNAEKTISSCLWMFVSPVSDYSRSQMKFWCDATQFLILSGCERSYTVV